MALYTQASDITTRQTVWVSRNVAKDRPQLNSHRDDRLGVSLTKAGIDGFSAAEIANLSCDEMISHRCPISGWNSLLNR